ncbi:Fe-S cluster assembly protein SufD [candidate division KSB1 bacterium]|nr:Fe-S cluster assembly protein SufD [candidate division KSB1 bacterium]
MDQKLTQQDWHKINFQNFEKKLNGQSFTPLHDLRKQAITRFDELGFPTIRKEEWRFTNISPITRIPFKLAAGGHDPEVVSGVIEPYTLKDIKHTQLIFMNGQYVPELSVSRLPEGVRVKNLDRALQEDKELIEKYLTKHSDYMEHEFTALNTAFISDGAFIHIPEGLILDNPIHILYMTSAAGESIVTHPRNLIIAGSNSRSSIIENYAGVNNDIYFTNPVTEIIAGENTVMDFYKLQQESAKAYHISALYVHQMRNSVFSSHSFSFGGSIVRNDIFNLLDGEGSDSILNGLYLAHKDQLIDNHSVIDHARPHCHSNEVYHGILDDKARAVFSGKIHVRPDAQKTDAIQSNKNILLSEEAMVDTKPQLEIFADDVRCTHGGTIGQIDENGVFYLRARGINEQLAKNIMIHAFAGEIIKNIKIDKFRDIIDKLVFSRLEDGHLKQND